MPKACFDCVVLKNIFLNMTVLLILLDFSYPCIVSADQKNQLYDDLFSISFPTAEHGWACGRWGTILHTEDGGKTWVHQNSGTDYALLSIFFVDPKNGWAVGDGGTIIHTEDGGQVWLKQKSPVPNFLMGVCFATARKGWIVTERTTVLHTEDGGRTWQVQFKDEDFILKSVSFYDEMNGWAVGESGFIYHTTDGGSTWQRQAGEFGFSPETGEIIGGNYLFNVVAISPMTAWAVGIDGYIAKTNDGGSTWQKVMVNVPKTHLFGVATNGATKIFIGGNSVLLMSADGGESFQNAQVEPPITYGWIYKVAQRGDAGFVAVGKAGRIYFTDRQAMVWRQIEY